MRFRATITTSLHDVYILRAHLFTAKTAAVRTKTLVGGYSILSSFKKLVDTSSLVNEFQDPFSGSSKSLLRLGSQTQKPLPTESPNEAFQKLVSSDNWKKFIFLARSEYKLLLYGCGFLLVSSFISMGLPFGIGKIIDLVVQGDPGSHLGLILFGLSGVFLIGGISNFCRVFVFKWCGERLVTRLRMQLYQKILGQNLEFFDKNRTGDLMSRLSLDSTLIGKSITNNVSDGIKSLLKAGIGGGMMYWISPALSGIIFSIVPPLAILGIAYGNYIKSLSKRTQLAFSEINKISEEKLSNVRTIKAFSQEIPEIGTYSRGTLEILSLAKKEALASGAFTSLAYVAANCALVIVLYNGGAMVASSALSIGDLSSFLMYTVYVGSSISGLSGFYSELMKGFGASSRVFEILDSSPSFPMRGVIGRKPEPFKGKIELKTVSFSYPARPQSPILNRVSLSVSPGQILAIVGSSGSGKSTLGSLLLRFYDPSSGEIILDEQMDLKDVDLEWWHSQISIVSQEPSLFCTSVEENIAYGNPSASSEQIQTAATQANAYSFIQKFPRGMSTIVGEKGLGLSGGQKQRIAIARAFLKDPKILVLDEATSALDIESEELVHEALDRLLKGRTVITITHRVSMIKKAHKIAVIGSSGSIEEFGTFEELSSNSQGLFYKLMNLKST